MDFFLKILITIENLIVKVYNLYTEHTFDDICFIPNIILFILHYGNTLAKNDKKKHRRDFIYLLP